MTDETFHLEMMRLEKLFNRGRALEDSIRDEYKESLAYVADDVLHKSVGAVIDTFKPFPSEPFPSVSTIIAAVMDVDMIVEPEVDPDYSVLDYCQLCGNLGLYPDKDKGTAKFCQCEKGRLKRAGWTVDAHLRKRQEKIQENLRKLPSAKPPVHGLMEKHKAGFWELNVMEHERWMDKRREKLAEQKRRQAEFAAQREAAKREIGTEPLKRVLAETLAQVSENVVPAEEDDSECPF